MPAAPRDFTITYGSYSVGAVATRILDGAIRTSQSDETFTLEFDFVVLGTTPAELSTEIAAAELAFRTPNQGLTVTGGDTLTNASWKSLSHASGTGTNSKPSIDDRGDVKQTGLSRGYTARVEFSMPANVLGSTSGRTGRRNSFVSIEYTPSRRRVVTIAGEFTQVGTTLARDQYEAQIASYAIDVLKGIGGTSTTWELIEEPFGDATDEHDGDPGAGKGSLIEFERSYQEIFFQQAGGTDPGVVSTASALSNPSIVNQRLSVSHTKSSPGDTRGTIRLETAAAFYVCAVDRTQTTDLKSLWKNTIQPFVCAEAAKCLGGGATMIVDESPSYNFDENTIRASITLMGGPVSSGWPIESNIRTDEEIDEGKAIARPWDGNKFSAYVYQGPAVRRRTITKSEIYLGNAFDEILPEGAPFFEGAVIRNRKAGVRDFRRGVGDKTMDFSERASVTLLEFYGEAAAAPPVPDRGGPRTIPFVPPANREAGDVFGFDGANIGNQFALDL